MIDEDIFDEAQTLFEDDFRVSELAALLQKVRDLEAQVKERDGYIKGLESGVVDLDGARYH